MLNLLIYIDGSNASQQAIQYIAPITHDSEVSVTLLTADRSEESGADLYSRMAGKLFAPSIRHVHRVEAADVALIREARRGIYDLAVFGPMRERWSRWVRISPQSSLSAQLPISSLLVRGDARQICRVLLCTGGDETIVDDAQLAARLARRAEATATVLHVVSQMPLLFGPSNLYDDATAAFAATDSVEIRNMRAAVDVLQASGVQAEIKVRIGLVLDEIVAELQEGQYDLLVIGAHRSENLVERLLLEDISQNMLGQSPVPVLVVKSVRIR
jgi:nucleotide-binding universal stress UspA family protein